MNTKWTEIYQELNSKESLPKENTKGEPIIIGCNYHTTWQSNKRMRFVLSSVKDNRATLFTRTTRKKFSTNLDDLIFINTKHNIKKAIKLSPECIDYITFKI